MSFTRGLDPKQALRIGLDKKLRSMMRNTEYDYEKISDVWEWALERKNRSIFFPYIVGMNGKKWVNGKKIDASDWNNELLWRSIEAKNIEAVKSLLKVPDLFRKETFKLDQGTSELEGEFSWRGDTKSPMRGTNFGVFINLAVEHYPDPEIHALLLDYYDKNRYE
jgi:hypothetical protein